MRVAALVAAILILATVLWDAFEAIVLPRTAIRKLRLARIYYRITWRAWTIAGRLVRGARREWYLGIYGPLSVLGLLVVWAIGLITGFALMRWAQDHQVSFPNAMYRSATTLFTLGSGEGLPRSQFERVMIVAEAGAGIGLLTM